LRKRSTKARRECRGCTAISISVRRWLVGVAGRRTGGGIQLVTVKGRGPRQPGILAALFVLSNPGKSRAMLPAKHVGSSAGLEGHAIHGHLSSAFQWPVTDDWHTHTPFQDPAHVGGYNLLSLPVKSGSTQEAAIADCDRGEALEFCRVVRRSHSVHPLGLAACFHPANPGTPSQLDQLDSRPPSKTPRRHLRATARARNTKTKPPAD
jgi:hypothetical protein